MMVVKWACKGMINDLVEKSDYESQVIPNSSQWERN